MAEGEMRDRAEEYEETVDPENPPQSTIPAAPVVAGMWYVLAPVGIFLLIIVLVFFYWRNRDRIADDQVEPTTGIEETTPGGINPDPKPKSPDEEREYRGGQKP